MPGSVAVVVVVAAVAVVAVAVVAVVAVFAVASGGFDGMSGWFGMVWFGLCGLAHAVWCGGCGVGSTQLDVRVRSMISQRDDAIANLKERLEESELRRKHAEAMLSKQRSDLLAAAAAT